MWNAKKKVRFFKHWLIVAVLIFSVCTVGYWLQGSGLSESYIGKDVPVIVAAMPKRDRKSLEYFFRESIGWDAFGYVLLGEKPMSLGTVEKGIKPFSGFSAFKHAISLRRIRYCRGYSAWRKYEKFFPMTLFKFLYEEDPRQNISVLLINKRSFIDAVQQHLADFKEVLQEHVDGEILLRKADHRALISDVLRNHDGLLGILLGYGRENAFLFHERACCSSEKEALNFCEEHQLGSAWTDEEFNAFCELFKTVSRVSVYITGSHLERLELMALPGFLAVSHSPETLHWRKHYLETRQSIVEYYKDKNFLEATLQLLTAKPARDARSQAS